MAARSEEHGNACGKTLFVRNLPYSTTNESLETVFSDVGPIKQCFVVSDKEDGKCRGFGYVKYTLLEDAQKALDTIKKVDGRNVHVMFANKKERKKKFGQPKPPPKVKDQDGEEEGADIKPDVIEVKEEPDNTPPALTKSEARKKARLENVKEEPKAHAEGKRARLIVRNLSFKCTETNLRNAFAKFGKIEEVHIPVKNDGKKLGFGFVQFSNKAEAGMAVKEFNGKSLLDRKVAVDFTLPKGKFEQKIAAKSNATESEEVKDEAMDIDDMEVVKEEDDVDVKEEEESENDDDDEDDNDDHDNEDSDSDEDIGSEKESEQGSESSDESEDEDKENSDDSFSDEDHAKSFKPNQKFQRKEDVAEGRTVFVRNVPFDMEEEAIEEYFTQFGVVKYARCVVDHSTGMSKGSAFVQFSSKDSADLCLKGSAQTGQHQLGGRELLVTLAVDRSTAQGLKKEKVKVPQDSRNLYLAREGMIRPGTQAAKDVPPADLAKRLKNDAMKRRKLSDQNTFISSTRLCFHNIPATITDKAMRDMILKGIDGKKSSLVEVKIMRDLNRVNSEGVAKSRGYAFIGFATHETALAALHHFNNNPDIFGPQKRPIVEFSIENRKALKTKEKRLEKAKMKLTQEKEKEAMQGKDKRGRKRKAAPSVDRKGQDKIARSMHSGPLGLPRHSGPKQRHKPRPSQTQGKTKKPKGFIHPAKAKQPRRQREPKLKQETSRRKKSRTDVDSFDKLVASHKKKMLSAGARF